MAAYNSNNDAIVNGAADRNQDGAHVSSSRALVVINPVTTERHARSRLADAMFLAHMFATKFRAPQTCEKRRAAPADAEASYRKTTQPAVRTGRIVSRKI